MSRPCKCRFCQTNLTTDVAHMQYVGKNKFYFCDEDHYEKYITKEETEKKKKVQRKELHDKVCELFSEILGVTKITNTALYKEKAELNEVYSDEVIISYLEENKGWMTTSVSKLSGGIYGKIRYVSVILRNKLGDYKPNVIVKETEKPKVQVDETFYEASSTTRSKRRSLADLEDYF